jgi:hypothetical protein
VPVSAVFTTSTRRLVLTFDQNIASLGALGATNLRVRNGSNLWSYSSTISVAGSVLTTQHGLPSSPGTPAGTTYAASPAQLTGTTGLPVLAFADFATTFV